MSQERDTHFAGFAHLLYEDFLQLRREDESSIKEMMGSDYPERWQKRVEQHIAQRGYDLVKYVLYQLGNCPGGLSKEKALEFAPDLTEWPIVEE